MGRWGSPKPKQSAQQKREQALMEMLEGKQDRRRQNSVLFLLLSSSTQFMTGFDAKQVRQRVGESLRVIRSSGFRIADSDIWHVLASNIYSLKGPQEVSALAQELDVDRQLVNFAVREVLDRCRNERRLTLLLLEKLNALRSCVLLPPLLWDDRRLNDARIRAEKEGAS